MSLLIEVDGVTGVLLADGWHKVEKFRDGSGRSSFTLDSYEFVEGDKADMVFGGGQDQLVPATGATWWELENPRAECPYPTQVSCPLTSVLAVRSGDN